MQFLEQILFPPSIDIVLLICKKQTRHVKTILLHTLTIAKRKGDDLHWVNNAEFSRAQVMFLSL
jgi:hypothetical protein